MDLRILIGGGGFLIFGVLICIGSFALGLGRLSKPGPGFLLFMAGSVVVILSIVDVIKGLFSKNLSIKVLLSIWEGLNWKKAILLLIGTLIYAPTLGFLGFFIPSVLYVGFCTGLLGVRKWATILVASVMSTIGFYLLIFYFKLSIAPWPDFLGF